MYRRGVFARRWVAVAAIIVGAALAVYVAAFTFARIDEHLLPGNEAAVPQVPVFVPGTNVGVDVSLPGIPSSRPEAWSPDARINVLVLGLDRRPWEPKDAAVRSDTMFIASIDTFHGRLQLLAIPRDFWAEVPYGSDDLWVEAKINAAYSFGQSQKYPGGGPAAAVAAVERNFSIDIDHYVVIDWEGFIRLIDALGGIDLVVPETISDFGTDVLSVFPNRTVTAGPHHFNGEEALAYSRVRSDGDLKRIERQQLVIRAAAEKAVSLGWIDRIPELWEAYHDAITTDITAGQIPGYALLAKRIDFERIETFSLGPALYPGVSDDGQLILLPRWDEVFAIIDEFFADPLTRDEHPRITIEYPAGAEAQAQAIYDHLVQYGVPEPYLTLKNGAGGEPGIVDFGGKTYTATKLALLSNLRLLDPSEEPPPEDDTDILVRVGPDTRPVLP